MKIKTNKAFTLIETLIATVIGMIAITAMYLLINILIILIKV